jgi:hypothetical protein
LHHAAAQAKVDGKLVLGVFGQDPDTRESFAAVRHFAIGDVDGMTTAAMEFEGVPHANLYSPLAIMRPDLPEGKKGTETDLVSVLGFVVDADADKGHNVVPPLPANYVIESSPGNSQHVLILDRPLSPQYAKRFGQALARMVPGAECISDISHPWRVAGGLNWPNAKKVHERNRPREPQPVRVIMPWQTWTSVDALREVLAPHWDEPAPKAAAVPSPETGRSLEELLASLPDRFREMLTRDQDGIDRSAHAFVTIGQLVAAEYSDEEIFALVNAHPDGVGQRYQDSNPQKLRDDIRRSRDKPHLRPKRTQEMFPGIVSPPLVPCPVPLPDHPNLTEPQAFALEDFVAYLPGGTFCYLPTGEHWSATGVNAKVGDVMVNGCTKIKAATWLSQNRSADAMAWSPGEPVLIKDRLLVQGGWIEKAGDTTLNNYRPATIEPREGDASLWLDHIKAIYPDDWQHIVFWLAHRVQRPGEKVNHALVLGGEPGIGKDSLLEPIKPAVGAWNFCDASPANIMGRFNSHLKSVIVRISEVHDLGDTDRFAFYERTKPVCAAPPDTHRIDEKNMREYQAVNICAVLMTTNYKVGGMYLPPNDRRHYVAWSPKREGSFAPEYFDKLYRWFATGGNEIVAHYLASLDISAFDPKAPPPKTPAFWEMVNASRSPEAAEMDDTLDLISTRKPDGTVERPKVVTLAMLSSRATGGLAEMLRDRKYRSQIAHRMADAGYELVRNPTAKDGLWKINGRRQAIYAIADLTTREKAVAAMELQNRQLLPPPPG